jgi:hypothetical protein
MCVGLYFFFSTNKKDGIFKNKVIMYLKTQLMGFT